ncbi:uncharacterized protein LOC133869429 [Alnus glutinosa]|uniref:uncharacterized protein LOC133869429 n=1 Tax=Alnus glutinosa TaxID=3517 RepID=UPI002D76D36C|nr:uncharacterized protein LOC133869429 [Alnus glutinosa]
MFITTQIYNKNALFSLLFPLPLNPQIIPSPWEGSSGLPSLFSPFTFSPLPFSPLSPSTAASVVALASSSEEAFILHQHALAFLLLDLVFALCFLLLCSSTPHLPGTRLSISFAATIRLHRHQKRFHRPPANRSVICTRRQGLNRFSPFPRLCWWSRAVRGVSRWREVLWCRRVDSTRCLRGLPAHAPLLTGCCCVVVFFFFLYFWAVLFRCVFCISLLCRIFCCIFYCNLCNGYPSGVWILVILQPPFTTFNGGPGSWHPCQGPIGPHLRKHCLRVLSFIGFNVFFLTLWVAQP